LFFLSWTIGRIGSYNCTHPVVSDALWLSFCEEVGIFKTTEGNGLKLHTLIWEHNRLVSKAHNSNIDFDRIMVHF
jgi:hypothetical protein